MKVHLADVGGIRDPFESRIPVHARAMRNGATGGGGGGGTPPEPEGEPEGGEEDDPEEEETEEETAPSPEDFKKLQAKATRRESALRKAQKEIAELKAEKEKPENGEPDPVAKANARLLSASARTVLTAAGVVEKDDQKLILSMIDLSDVDVDDEDGPDEDAIEEKIGELRRIFGGTAKPDRPGSRTPRGVKAPDRSKGETVDGDTARYRRIIGSR